MENNTSVIKKEWSDISATEVWWLYFNDNPIFTVYSKDEYLKYKNNMLAHYGEDHITFNDSEFLKLYERG